MSRLSNGVYKLGRPGAACNATGKALSPGEAYVAALVEHAEDDELDRIDLCLDAWEGGFRPERLFAHWRGVVREADDERRTALDNDEVLDAFSGLADAGGGDDRRRAFRYVLALVLIRKKLLVQAGARREEVGGAVSLFVWPRGLTAEQRRSTPPEEVSAPALTPEVLADVREQLAVLLGLES